MKENLTNEGIDEEEIEKKVAEFNKNNPEPPVSKLNKIYRAAYDETEYYRRVPIASWEHVKTIETLAINLGSSND